jgi:N-methylhydantoinase A
VKVFEDAYRKLYGVNPSHVPIELVTWRVTARGPIIPFSRATALPDTPGRPRTSRPVHAWSEGAETPVYDRKALAAGQIIPGPAIIEERETTTVIPPSWSATIDRVGCIIAQKG